MYFFWKFVSKWDSYGHSKSGKSKSAVASPAPYQLYASLYWCRSWGAREASQAPWCAAIILKAVDSPTTGLRATIPPSKWLPHTMVLARLPWHLSSYTSTGSRDWHIYIELIRRRRSHSALWLTRLRMAITVSFRNEFSKKYFNV